MNIVKKETFEVNGHRFTTEADAQAYIDSINKEKSKLDNDRAMLNATNMDYVPVWVEEEQTVDIMMQEMGENRNCKEWHGLRDGKKLRYYDTEIKVISPDEWMNKLKEYHQFYIDTNEWNDFLMGVIYINEKCRNPVDWKEIVHMLACLQVAPQIVYHD